MIYKPQDVGANEAVIFVRAATQLASRDVVQETVEDGFVVT